MVGVEFNKAGSDFLKLKPDRLGEIGYKENLWSLGVYCRKHTDVIMTQLLVQFLYNSFGLLHIDKFFV